MGNPLEAECLVASMFAFAARFLKTYDSPTGPDDCPPPTYFAQLASNRLNSTLDHWGDIVPPFWLLQASVLITFHQLTRSVRSRSWRSLGSCIRLAYDMNIHLTDANSENRNPNPEQWSAFEERRRTWWAIWEMDVFASTIRRLPLSIDWTQNCVFLPASDVNWFNGTYQASCYLQVDPTSRWKRLSQSGNTSARAWFIVINSLMRTACAQLVMYTQSPGVEKNTESTNTELNILANCLYCATASMPPELVYQGEYLGFGTRTSSQGTSLRQLHCDIYSLHLMSQLFRFITHHHKICAQAPWLNKDRQGDGACSQVDRSAWHNYMKACDDIVTIVRNSSSDHHKYINPFLINTLWFAASAQIACKVFGPDSINKQLASSNFDLLTLAIDKSIEFWDCVDILKHRLSRIEGRLERLMQDGQDGDAEALTQREVAMAPQPNPTNAEATSLDPGGFSFAIPPVYDGLGPSVTSGGHDFFLGEPEPFFPYGVDELWIANRLPLL